jgi:hypothetical protein
MPWVGDRYKDTGLLVLGFNMNNAGGWDILHSDEVGVPAARGELLVRRKIRLVAPYSAYRGTLFDNYMLPCVWAALLKIAPQALTCEMRSATLNTIAKAARSVSDTNRKALTDMYDYHAFTQLVKCGLKSEWGSPTSTMSNTCPSHVLARELDILIPPLRFILGFGAFAPGSVNPLVLGRDIRTAYLPHPTWPRFNLDAALKSLWSQI